MRRFIESMEQRRLMSTAPVMPVTFDQATYLLPDPGQVNDIASGDFDGDGTPDIAALVWGPFGGPSRVDILLGEADGGFVGGTSFTAPSLDGSSAEQIDAGDFNGDGRADLYLSRLFSHGNDVVLLSGGDGGFGPALDAGLPGGSWPAVGDFNGDGSDDIAVAWPFSGEPPRTFVRYGTPTGLAPAVLASRAPIFRIGAVADMDGDGSDDIVAVTVLNGEVGVGVLPGVRDGTFGLLRVFILGGYFEPNELVVGDFTGDGRLDLRTDGTPALLVGDGAGGFVDAVRWDYSTVQFYEAQAADLNGDDYADPGVGSRVRNTLTPLVPSGKWLPVAMSSTPSPLRSATTALKWNPDSAGTTEGTPST